MEAKARAAVTKWVWMGCAAASILAAGTCEAQAREAMAVLRSVTAAVELVGELPRLVLVARGVSARNGGRPVEVRTVVDPGRCSIPAEPYRRDLDSVPARELAWHHIVWRDGGLERVIGTALAVADEMPGPGPRRRWELLSLPRARFGYNIETGRFHFQPDLASAALRPHLAGPEAVAGKTVWISPMLAPCLAGVLETTVRQLGGRLSSDCKHPVEVAVAADETDFVDTRDPEIEVHCRTGASVIYAAQLLGSAAPGPQRDSSRASRERASEASGWSGNFSTMVR